MHRRLNHQYPYLFRLFDQIEEQLRLSPMIYSANLFHHRTVKHQHYNGSLLLDRQHKFHRHWQPSMCQRHLRLHLDHYYQYQHIRHCNKYHLHQHRLTIAPQLHQNQTTHRTYQYSLVCYLFHLRHSKCQNNYHPLMPAV